MPSILSPTAQEILQAVVRSFTGAREATLVLSLIHEFEEPAAVRTLVSLKLLELYGSGKDEIVLPTVLAFHFCGDATSLGYAKSAVEMVVPAIKRLARADWEFSGTYTLQDLLNLSWVNTVPDRGHMALGLFLARDFKEKILSGWKMDDSQACVLQFGISTEIVAVKDAGRLWDDHIRAGVERIEGSMMETQKSDNTPSITPTSRKVFVVHGHDGEAKQAVARFLEKLALQPVILHEQPNKGQTLIEKFEANSDVAFAVVILTPDDEARARDAAGKRQPFNLRARQNVILELGFFFGKLKRAQVCALYKEGVELPSDMDGIVYVPYDDHDGWKAKIAAEIRAAGLAVDMNFAA